MTIDDTTKVAGNFLAQAYFTEPGGAAMSVLERRVSGVHP